MRKKLLFFIFSLGLSVSAHSQEISSTEWAKASSVAIACAGMSAALMRVDTPACTWCASNAFDQSISEKIIIKEPRSLYLSSDLLAFAFAPLVALSGAAFSVSSFSQFSRDALIITDSVMLTLALTEMAKITFARARPETVFLANYKNNRQSNRSFWSGHTSLVCAMLTTSSLLALRNNHSWAPYFAAGSALLGIGVGYTRIAAAKHWASDVLVGMAVGFGVGLALPFLILDPKNSASNKNNTHLVTLRFAW